MKEKFAPDLTKRTVALDAAVAHKLELVKCGREVDARLTLEKENSARQLVESCTEIMGLGSAADARAHGALLRASDDAVTILTHTNDLIGVRINAAKIECLECALGLVQGKELLANIDHSLARSQMLDKAITAGLFASGRLALFSEEVDTLGSIAVEAARQVTLAENELREERARQQAAYQTRRATGMVTRAEVASAIPSFQGSSTT
ncbi:MAG: hypothetical protein LAQ69_20230 [Acidobacteriia bacterium]|nr:hypothetical protein [Terriglobia bacterium]